MIDPAEIAELRELLTAPKSALSFYGHTRKLKLLEKNGIRLLDAAERCARLEEALAGVVELCAVFEKDALRGLARPLPRYIEGGYRDRLTHVRAIKEFVEALQPAAQLDAADSESREDEQRDDHDDRS